MKLRDPLKLSLRDYLVTILASLFVSFIIGSRMSYFFVTFGGRYFPEPILLGLLLYALNRNRLFQKNFVAIFLAWLIFVVITFYLSEISSINLFFMQNYATLRGSFVGLILPFIICLSFRKSIFKLRFILKWLLFFQFFSLFSCLMGIYSINLPEPEGVSILSSFSGLRSLQSFLSPMIFNISSIYIESIKRNIRISKILAITVVTVLMSLACFYYGLSRISLLPIPFSLGIFAICLLSKNKKVTNHITVIKAFLLLLIISPVLIFVATNSVSLMSTLASDITVSTKATLSGVWEKAEILDAALGRTAISSGENSVRLAMVFNLLINSPLFLLPFSLEVSRLDDKFASIFEDTFYSSSVDFLSLADSGFVYIAVSYGLIFTAYVMYMSIKFANANIHKFSKVIYRQYSGPIIAAQFLGPLFLFSAIITTAPFFNMFLSFSLLILIVLIFLTPRLIYNSFCDNDEQSALIHNLDVI